MNIKGGLEEASTHNFKARSICLRALLIFSEHIVYLRHNSLEQILQTNISAVPHLAEREKETSKMLLS